MKLLVGFLIGAILVIALTRVPLCHLVHDGSGEIIGSWCSTVMDMSKKFRRSRSVIQFWKKKFRENPNPVIRSARAA